MDKELILIANKLRKRIVETSFFSKIPHLGSCLSCLDLLVYLYFEELSIDPKQPNEECRDRFILSKGHGAPALFQVLAEKEFFPLSRLNEFGKNGSVFHEHPPKPGYIPGVEAATGSLGHGFSMALGMAVSAKIKSTNFRCYAMLSDGECNEGSIWEAALLAPSLKLDNLTIIVDFNKWQATGRSEEIMSLQPLNSKWQSFGWHVQEINGHEFREMEKAFKEAKLEKNKPSAIIAHTIKGKGVSFIEDDNNWHYKIPSKEELKLALEELGF
tara:strand:+ start:1535 stop:2347 length:813 start_codon:yes stop_codon:yes gene_type:complete